MKQFTSHPLSHPSIYQFVHRIVAENTPHFQLCYSTVMRIIGIDYGSKRVGIALTDESGRMAFPHDTFDNDEQFLKKLVSLIEEKKVSEVVIGHSLNRDGKPNAIHADVEGLVTDLTLHTGLPVHLHPEQYTTQEALRSQERTRKTDASAAAILLNSYLTSAK